MNNIGLVKWFGGLNSKTGKQNEFGFIETPGGTDVFIHLSKVKSAATLSELDIVIFDTESKKGKTSAKNLRCSTDSNLERAKAFELYVNQREEFPLFFESSKFEKSLTQLTTLEIDENDASTLRSIILNRVPLRFFPEEVIELNQDQIIELILSLNDSEKVSYLEDNWGLISFDNYSVSEVCQLGVNIDEMSTAYINKWLSDYVEILPKSKLDEFLYQRFDDITADNQLLLIIDRLLPDESVLEGNKYAIERVLKEYLLEDYSSLDMKVKERLNDYFRADSSISRVAIIDKIYEPLVLKTKLFQKDDDVLKYYNSSDHMIGNVECFILANLFTLIQSNESLDDVYSVLLHRIWQLLSTGRLDLTHPKIFSLFPKCTVMGDHDLSCEAFYWEDKNTYLCRGKKCSSPGVMPDEYRDLFEFSIFDWFSHYGINYSSNQKPTKRDFPIKLAGYFNRLREIFPRLHCRTCDTTLKPNLKYARVEYTEIVEGKPVIKSMSAAYRATVFECGNLECADFKQSSYISHCVGFGCDSVIDSRDLTVKCDRGLYVCGGCGSCCAEDAKNNPIGLCPGCGGNLGLFEDQTKPKEYGKYPRVVECKNSACRFSIVNDLPKRFLSKTMPIQVRRA